MNKKIISLLITNFILLNSCGYKVETINSSNFAFGTFISTTLYNKDKEYILNELKEIINYYHKLFNTEIEYPGINNLYSINHTNEFIKLDKDLYEAIKIAFSYKDLTNSYFEPFIGDLCNSWKDSLENNKILDPVVINEKLDDIKNTTLKYDDSTYTVQRIGNAKLDFGAFGKGYLLKILKDYFEELNYPNYLINAGSSSILLGTKGEEVNFNISFKYLENKYFTTYNTSIGTSAIYEQIYTVNNINYSHIVNPFTGSAIPNYDFILIDHQDPILTDVFSTAFMNMGLDMIKKYEKDYNLKIVVSKNKDIFYKTENFEIKTGIS